MGFMRLKNLAFTAAIVAICASFAAAQDAVKTLNGGVLNGKAISLPKPAYPDLARKAGVEGAVRVEVIIDENGNIESAAAVKDADADNEFASEVVDGKAALRSAAEAAALEAKFSPTLLSGVPVKVRGTIVYNFAMKSAPETTGKGAINGGILNGRATELPKAEYPAAALAVRAQGSVVVNVMIDEGGNVIQATAVSGHPLLQASAVTAARKARFVPTMLSGQPVRVSGMLTYAFVLPEKDQ
jgi:TonB family protein